MKNLFKHVLGQDRGSAVGAENSAKFIFGVEKPKKVSSLGFGQKLNELKKKISGSQSEKKEESKTRKEIYRHWSKKFVDLLEQNQKIFEKTKIISNIEKFIDQNATEEFKKEHALFPTFTREKKRSGITYDSKTHRETTIISGTPTLLSTVYASEDKEGGEISVSRANEYMKQLFEMFEKFVEREKENQKNVDDLINKITSFESKK